jgi:pimeloyl-ACP methyl ester carboxylesterase
MSTFDIRNIPVQTTRIDDIALAYRIFGSGETLILINGFASAMDTWNPPILQALARQFRVVIFDTRGTGCSGSSGKEYSIPLFAMDTLRLMAVLGISSAHILGYSMGAMIAQELTLRSPERVRKLVLVSGDCGGREAVRMTREVWATLGDKRGTLQEQAARMFSLLFPAQWLRDHDPWDACPEVWETTPEEHCARQLETLRSWAGACGRLPAIRSPVLVATGTDDVIIPPENSEILAGRIHGARLVRFTGGGHGFMYQFPDEFAGVLLSFLTGTTYSQ